MKHWFATEDGYIFSYKVERSPTKLRQIAGQYSITKGKDGYCRIKFNKTSVLVHRLVWNYFKGEIPIGLEINHIDGNKQNNTLSNLELVTKGENLKHAYKLGLKKSWNKKNGVVV